MYLAKTISGEETMRALDHRKPHWVAAALTVAALVAVALYAYQSLGRAATTSLQDMLDTATAGVADMGHPHLRLLQGGRL